MTNTKNNHKQSDIHNIMNNTIQNISKITGGESDNTVLFIVLAVIIIIVFGLGLLYIYDPSILENLNPINHFSAIFNK